MNDRIVFEWAYALAHGLIPVLGLPGRAQAPSTWLPVSACLEEAIAIERTQQRYT